MRRAFQDDLMLAMMLRSVVFEPLGVAAVHTCDGKAALEAVATAAEPFDVVLMDNMMPHMSGTEATLELRRRGFGGIIVGMTGQPAAPARPTPCLPVLLRP